MKTVLEFGVRGGVCVESVVLPSIAIASKLALNLVRVFTNDAGYKTDFSLAKDMPRKSWQSSSHFVSISILDGKMRGPATPSLWKKEN